MSDCLFCGKQIPARATSCPNCRAPVSGVQAPPPSLGGSQEERLPVPPREFPEGCEGELLKLLAAGKKIEAIKLYCERTGSRLKESKEAVEALGKQHGIAAAKSGCAGVVLAVACIGTVTCMWWYGSV